jgi:deoxycytidine triphosphate deaminase
MILVDKNIKELVNENKLIVSNYNEDNLGCVSYDLTLDKIILENEELEEYELNSKEFVIVKTLEELEIPSNLVGKISEKNSLMRTGLKVDGPIYQPGHKTYCFLRVFNLSNQKIKLSKSLKIAQIFFEQLTEIPEKTYNQIEKSSFNNENKYLGYGNYTEEYKKL